MAGLQFSNSTWINETWNTFGQEHNICRHRFWRKPYLIARDAYANLYQRQEHDYRMQAPWPYKRSIGVQGVNTRHSRTLKSIQSPWDQQSKVQPCIANCHSAAESRPGLVHMRSTCTLPTGVWTLSTHPPYNISIWNEAYHTTQTRASPRNTTVNPIRTLVDQILCSFYQDIAYKSDT